MPAPGCLTDAELTAFHLGELPETELSRVAAHLEGCRTCDEAIRALDGLSDPTLTAYRRSALAGPLPDARVLPGAVPGYEILGELGRGGMGVVYKARQLRLGRVVALKMLLGGYFADREQRERFRAEAEAVARLQHPNVVQLFETGEHDDGTGSPRPYFTLEYVEGGGLDRRLAGRPLPPQRAAAWIEVLARAVDYAHAQGVIHRDLKPSNVLLTADGTPKVCDFGVAKLLGGSGATTVSGLILGTAEYMAPEQAEARPAPGPAADVYALGVILYEMLAGRPPFKGATTLDTLGQVRTQEPVPVRRLQPAVPRDLETICLKCLEKGPRRRYPSAAALADDLRRFLAHEPIAARPARPWERAVKWARRRPAVAALAAAVVAAVALGVAGAGWGWRQAVTERGTALEERGRALRLADDLRAERDAAEWLTYRAEIAAAGDALQLNNAPAAGRHLKAAPERFRDWEWHYFAARLDTARDVLDGHRGVIRGLAFPPDGRRLVSASTDRTARLWEVGTGKTLAVWGYDSAVNLLALRPDGQRLACATNAGTLALHNLAAPYDMVVRPEPGKQAAVLAYSPDGRLLALDANDGRPTLRDGADGAVRFVLGDGRPFRRALAFSPDSKWLAVAAGDGSVTLWGTADGRPGESMRGHRGIPVAAAFSPDGRFLVTAGQHPDSTLRLWRLGNAAPVALLEGHTGPIHGLTFSPDGSRVASASGDGTARVWDGTTGRPLATLTGHSAAVGRALFSPDGRRLVTASEDQTLRVWDAASGNCLSVLRGHAGGVRLVAWAPDGTRLASAAADMVVRLWDPNDVRRIDVLRGHTDGVSDVVFSPDGTRVLSAGMDRTCRLWELATGQEAAVLRHNATTHTCLAFSHDGGKFLTVSSGDVVGRLWDLSGGKEEADLPPPAGWRPSRGLAFHPAGALAAAGGKDGSVLLWDVAARRPLARLDGHRGHVLAVAFSPDGRLIASADSEGMVCVWDVESRRLRAELKGHGGMVFAVTFSADGRLIASGGLDQTVRLWDAESGAERACLRHDSTVSAVRFHPGGRRLAAACADGTIRLWDVASGDEVAELRGHNGYVHAIAFSPDGTRLVSGSGDLTVRLWDATPSPRRDH